MALFEAVIRALIYLCLVVAAYFLVVWVIQSIGLAIPPQILHILMVILILIGVLVLVRLFAPYFRGPWFPPH